MNNENPESGEVLYKNEYSEQEHTTWKEGASKYAQFAESFPLIDEISKDTKGQIKALFLKEKPAIFALKDLAILSFDLKKSGFKILGKYVYDPELVQSIIDSNHEIFSSYGLDAEEVMEKLSIEDNNDVPIIRGLVLGFPLAAVIMYEKKSTFPVHKLIKKLYDIYEVGSAKHKFILRNFYNKPTTSPVEIMEIMRGEFMGYSNVLGITEDQIPDLLSQIEVILDQKGFSAYGNGWVDSSRSVESEDREKRLKTAFESSGILEI